MASKKTQEKLAKKLDAKKVLGVEKIEIDTDNEGNIVKVTADGQLTPKSKEKITKAKEKEPVYSMDVQKFVAEAKKSGLKVEETGSLHKILGVVKGEKMYIAKNGRLVDLSSFTIKHDAVQQFTKDEAKARHIGKVQGRYIPVSPKTDGEVISKALKVLARK